MDLTIKDIKAIGRRRKIAEMDKKLVPWAWILVVVIALCLIPGLLLIPGESPSAYSLPDGTEIVTHGDYITVDGFVVEGDANLPPIGAIVLLVLGVLALFALFGLAGWEIYAGIEYQDKFLMEWIEVGGKIAPDAIDKK